MPTSLPEMKRKKTPRREPCAGQSNGHENFLAASDRRLVSHKQQKNAEQHSALSGLCFHLIKTSSKERERERKRRNTKIMICRLTCTEHGGSRSIMMCCRFWMVIPPIMLGFGMWICRRPQLPVPLCLLIWQRWPIKWWWRPRYVWYCCHCCYISLPLRKAYVVIWNIVSVSIRTRSFFVFASQYPAVLCDQRVVVAEVALLLCERIHRWSKLWSSMLLKEDGNVFYCDFTWPVMREQLRTSRWGCWLQGISWRLILLKVATGILNVSTHFPS